MFLKEVKEKTLIAFENQDYPFEELVEKLVQKKDWSRNPLFDTAIAWQDLEVDSQYIPGMTLPALKVKPIEHKNKVSRFDMAFVYTEADGKLLFTVEYCTKLFKKETIEIFSDCFKEIASSVIKNRESKLEDITLSSDIGIIKSTILQNEVGDFGF
jgi:non-ribosomal peptide synthetase component F